MKKIFIALFTVVILITLTIFFYFKNEVKEQKIYTILDQMRLTLQTQLKNQKMEDLRVALLLSKNNTLIDKQNEGYAYIPIAR